LLPQAICQAKGNGKRPGSPALLRLITQLGQVYANNYDYPRGAVEFREATRLEPENGYAWSLLSWALGYLQPPDAQAAERAAREAIRLQPTLFPAYYQLGRALLLQGHYTEALAAFKHAKEISPTSTAPEFGIAQVYLAQSEYDKAISLLLKPPVKTNTPVVLFVLSSAYAGRGDKEKALATLEQALAAGYRDFAAIDASPHFASLRADPRFQKLVRKNTH
jgi:tetratricopeptide (TPR) repeat protein